MYEQFGSVFSSEVHHKVGDVVIDLGGIADTSCRNINGRDWRDLLATSTVIITSLCGVCDCMHDDVRKAKGVSCICHYETYNINNTKKFITNVPPRYLLTLDEALEYFAYASRYRSGLQAE